MAGFQIRYVFCHTGTHLPKIIIDQVYADVFYRRRIEQIDTQLHEDIGDFVSLYMMWSASCRLMDDSGGGGGQENGKSTVSLPDGAKS